MRMRDGLRDPWIAGAALVALTIALLYGFLGHPLWNPDDYVPWGTHFGRWWRTAQDQFQMRTPGYPLFLAANFALGLKHVPIIVIQSLVLAFTCVGTAALTGEAAGRRAARITAWGFAAYFPLLTYAGTAMTEVLATGLILLAVSFTVAVGRDPDRAVRRGFCAALAATFAMIIHPNVSMYYGVLVIALLVLARGGGLRRRLGMLGVIVACAVAVFTPWVVRNIDANGHPAPLGSSSTYPLALGLHLPWDKTSGRYGSHIRSDNFFGGIRPDGFTSVKARTTHPIDELKDDVEHHLGAFLESRALGVYNMWSYVATPRIQDGEPEVIPYGYLRTVQLMLVILGWFGLFLLRRTLFGKLGLLLSGVTFVVELIYWANPRYVIPIAPYLIGGTGVTLAAAWDLARRRIARWRGGARDHGRDALGAASASGSASRGDPIGAGSAHSEAVPVEP